MTDSTRALILASALANTLLETLRDVGDHVVDAGSLDALRRVCATLDEELEARAALEREQAEQ